jgi:hypothetical protein
VALDQRRHGGAAPAQRRQRPLFVRPHETGISRSIRAKERRQPPPDLVRHGVILAQKRKYGAGRPSAPGFNGEADPLLFPREEILTLRQVLN